MEKKLVKCINNEGGFGIKLTVGKNYEVSGQYTDYEDKVHYHITDDLGNNCTPFAHRFVDVEEIVEQEPQFTKEEKEILETALGLFINQEKDYGANYLLNDDMEEAETSIHLINTAKSLISKLV